MSHTHIPDLIARLSPKMATWTVHLEGGPRRVNHAAVAIGSKIYSFGGYCSGEIPDARDPLDVHVLDTYNFRWQKVLPNYHHEDHIYTQSDLKELHEENEGEKASGTIPYQRYGHTAVEYDGKAYVWGGRNDDFGACNLLHEYDPENNVWKKVEVGGFIPPSRDGHTAVVWNNKMFVFGGFEEEFQRFSQDTYVFDFATSTWREMRTKTDPPLWRDFHTASVIDGVMYIFGGRSDHMGQVGDEHLFHTTQDLYDDTLMALNLTTGEWSKPEVEEKAIRPGGRRSHSTWVFCGKMYMFGGYLGTRNVHYNELYCFDPKTVSWKIISVRGKYPTPRRRHCSVVCNGKVYLFGGTMPNPVTCHPLSNTNAYNGIISPSGLADLSDLHVLDFAPSLKTMALTSVLHNIKAPSHGMFESLKYEIPYDLRYEMYCRIKPNNVSTNGSYRNDQSG